MRKMIALILAIVVVMTMAGCGVEVKKEEVEETKVESMFIVVEESYLWDIVYHRETGVMYAVSGGHNNLGTFTALVNADGTPMIWKGYDG